jgi:two-component system, cell cycle response regulator DivK
MISELPISSSSQTRELPQRKLVLLVDDNPDIRWVYTTVLRSAGFRVAEAENGVAAVERAIQLVPDVIVMDITMPMVGGWEASRRIKRNPKTSRTPIVVLSAQTIRPPFGEAAWYEAFLLKPVEASDFVRCVTSVLSG